MCLIVCLLGVVGGVQHSEPASDGDEKKTPAVDGDGDDRSIRLSVKDSSGSGSKDLRQPLMVRLCLIVLLYFGSDLLFVL